MTSGATAAGPSPQLMPTTSAPSEESVTAAKLVLEGADVAGESLYFLAPTLTNNHWIMENRDYIMTIGVHWFYK